MTYRNESELFIPENIECVDVIEVGYQEVILTRGGIRRLAYVKVYLGNWMFTELPAFCISREKLFVGDAITLFGYEYMIMRTEACRLCGGSLVSVYGLEIMKFPGDGSRRVMRE